MYHLAIFNISGWCSVASRVVIASVYLPICVFLSVSQNYT